MKNKFDRRPNTRRTSNTCRSIRSNRKANRVFDKVTEFSITILRRVQSNKDTIKRRPTSKATRKPNELNENSNKSFSSKNLDKNSHRVVEEHRHNNKSRPEEKRKEILSTNRHKIEFNEQNRWLLSPLIKSLWKIFLKQMKSESFSTRLINQL